MNKNKGLSPGAAITVIIIILVVIIGFVVLSLDSGSGASNKTVTCKVCKREFSMGTSDSKSINRTNMCTNCYNNYKQGQAALGRN